MIEILIIIKIKTMLTVKVIVIISIIIITIIIIKCRGAYRMPTTTNTELLSTLHHGWKPYIKVYDIINCLNKNLTTHFVWYLEKEKSYDIETFSIDRVLNKEHFYGRVMQKMCSKCALVPDPFLILVNNLKKPLHARNSFRNKISWESFINKLWKS